MAGSHLKNRKGISSPADYSPDRTVEEAGNPKARRPAMWREKSVMVQARNPIRLWTGRHNLFNKPGSWVFSRLCGKCPVRSLSPADDSLWTVCPFLIDARECIRHRKSNACPFPIFFPHPFFPSYAFVTPSVCWIKIPKSFQSKWHAAFWIIAEIN